jgi:hypothetical protein
MESYSGYTHLKHESENPRRSNANDKTLCGRDDPGLYAYMTVEPGQELPPESEAYPYCPGCVAEHEGAEAHVAGRE